MGDAQLTEALERLAAAAQLTDVLETVRKAARAIVSADGATVVLREDDKCFYADEDAMSPLWKGQRFPARDCISGWAMVYGKTAVVRDVTLDDRIPIEAYRPTFVKSLAMVPVGRPAIAAIGTYWAHHHAATAEDIEMLETLANSTAEALDRIGLDGAPFTPTSARDTYAVGS